LSVTGGSGSDRVTGVVIRVLIPDSFLEILKFSRTPLIGPATGLAGSLVCSDTASSKLPRLTAADSPKKKDVQRDGFTLGEPDGVSWRAACFRIGCVLNGLSFNCGWAPRLRRQGIPGPRTFLKKTFIDHLHDPSPYHLAVKLLFLLY